MKNHPECQKLVYVSSTGATQHVLDAAKEGLNACVVHPSGILEPDDMAEGDTTKTIIKIIKGEMPIGMQGSFNLCDVRDLAAGCIAAADKELHCGTCKAYLPLGLAKKLAKMMEKKAAHGGTQPIMTTFSVYNLVWLMEAGKLA